LAMVVNLIEDQSPQKRIFINLARRGGGHLSYTTKCANFLILIRSGFSILRRSNFWHSHKSKKSPLTQGLNYRVVISAGDWAYFSVCTSVWLGSLTATWRTCNPEVTQGRRFDSAPGHRRETTLGKLFTHMCLCHQAV